MCCVQFAHNVRQMEGRHETTPSPRMFEGEWLHSSGAQILIKLNGDDFEIDNPATGLRLYPVRDFFSHDGLRFYEHRGELRGNRILWSNGVVWTFQRPLQNSSLPVVDTEELAAMLLPRRNCDDVVDSLLLRAAAGPADMMPVAEKKYFVARGQVQNVMFRQTIIRAMLGRGIRGGATNCSTEADRVDFTLAGPPDAVEDLLGCLHTGQPINNWGARVLTLRELPSGLELHQHQVTTDNVESFAWNPNVEMFI
eukprot:TRINITY_DN116297_c0_g1_i1.p1 TRINITY_DN116297_c0_g1~~TRINITY_DN116297_c0_g1_i1.p1  ORF type:complete len:261 (-),score=20.76 TRINITY_DN116297_c0_g1_i1:105-863(-)